jgi:asparagine synthase (glutamine-hydrolysing)
MCGICGLVKRRRVADGDAESLRAMNRAMVHRGPDGEGEYAGDHVLLAMRRLSIIDLQGGWQPLYNEDRSIALVANGEIYNFIELRAMLMERGHRFRSGSDCETIVHLYEEYGLEFVQHLRGMFAIALWDVRKGRLILVRDRMGEKPLYLFEQDGKLLFASEMKALLQSGCIDFALDHGAIFDYFHYDYVPEPRTAIRAVRKLPAGHMLLVDVGPWTMEERCYWRMEEAPALSGDPVVLIREQLEQISEILLRSEVPVGVALSSGLDSSMVAALAARKSPGQIHALTIGFEGAGWRDERNGARDLARYLDMPFHELEISLDDVVTMFPQNCVDKDDPIADVAAHGYDAVSRLAREQGIPVLLQGQGVDELCWGYGWLRSAMAASTRKFETPHRVFDWASLRTLLPRNLHFTGLRDYALMLSGKVMGWGRTPPGAKDQLCFYDQSRTYRLGAYAAPKLFSPAWRESLRDHNPAALFTVPAPHPDLGVLLTTLACQTYLVENGIAQGDRLAMKSSIELRLPLVDYRLVETVIGLRKTQPDHQLAPKAWFKDVARTILPEWVLQRPKIGFSPPASLWMNVLREKYGPDVMSGYLVESGILNPDCVRMLLKPYSPLTPWPLILYKVLVLEYWARGMRGCRGGSS